MTTPLIDIPSPPQYDRGNEDAFRSGLLAAVRAIMGMLARENLAIGGDLTVSGGDVTITPAGTVSTIKTDTVDGTDTAQLKLTPTSSPSGTRGAVLQLSGNEEVTLGNGYARLASGNVAGALVQIHSGLTGTGIAVSGTEVTDSMPHVAPYYRHTVLTPAAFTGNQDNFAAGDVSVLRISTDASRDLTGIAGGASGRQLHIYNVGANPLVLKNDVTSTAANRFLNTSGADITLAANEGAIAIYDASTQRWRTTELN